MKGRESRKACEVMLGLFVAKDEEGRDSQHTPFPFGEVRVCCWVIKVSAEHGFCTCMEIIREHQSWGRRQKREKTLSQFSIKYSYVTR